MNKRDGAIPAGHSKAQIMQDTAPDREQIERFAQGVRDRAYAESAQGGPAGDGMTVRSLLDYQNKLITNLYEALDMVIGRLAPVTPPSAEAEISTNRNRDDAPGLSPICECLHGNNTDLSNIDEKLRALAYAIDL